MVIYQYQYNINIYQYIDNFYIDLDVILIFIIIDDGNDDDVL